MTGSDVSYENGSTPKSARIPAQPWAIIAFCLGAVGLAATMRKEAWRARAAYILALGAMWSLMLLLRFIGDDVPDVPGFGIGYLLAFVFFVAAFIANMWSQHNHNRRRYASVSDPKPPDDA